MDPHLLAARLTLAVVDQDQEAWSALLEGLNEAGRDRLFLAFPGLVVAVAEGFASSRSAVAFRLRELEVELERVTGATGTWHP